MSSLIVRLLLNYKIFTTFLITGSFEMLMKLSLILCTRCEFYFKIKRNLLITPGV